MTPLEIFNLPVGSTLNDVKKRWRSLAQQNHPDHNPDNPDAAQRFLEVSEAYQAIINDPDLLNGIQKPGAGFLSFVKATIPVTIADFYIGKEISVHIDRTIYCKHCSGTGSESKKVCSHCNGAGQIKSTVLNLLNRSPVCPVCKGSGIPEGNTCTKCGGSRQELDRSLRKLRLTLKDYHRKVIVLREAGNQTSKDSYGNAFIKLDIKLDDHVLIEEDYFSVYQKVLPIQKVIGDDGVLQIFGRRVPYRIEKNSTETYVWDTIRPGLRQQVRIRFIETPPVLIEDTIILYKKILEIEKQTSL